MKKIIMILLVLLLPLLSKAKERELDQAMKIAEDFLEKSITRSSDIELRMVWSGSVAETKSSGNNPAFYVFDNVSGPGYVMVSGDDKVIPVLGYSYENNFDADNMPPNLVSWMLELERQIRFVASSSLYSTRTSDSNNIGNVVVKYETAKWDQDAPYNNECPKDGDVRSVAGCLSTAMAIIMRYHKWPDAGQGTIPSYVTSTKGITVPPRSLGTSYDWENMPLVYDNNSTNAQNKAVATLMADCGAAVMMDYTAESSGAVLSYAAQALIKYMKYDKSIVQYSRGGFSDTEWYEKLQNEIKTNGPMLYSGYSADAGHAFVLDGYTDQNYYSLNWGWGGECDGYYVLDALNPDGQGIGGNVAGFNLNQEALFNVAKHHGGTYQDVLSLTFYQNEYGETLGGLDIHDVEPRKGVPFTLTAGLVCNTSFISYIGRVAVVVADASNNIKEELAVQEFSGLNPGYGYVLEDEYTYTINLDIGDQLILVYWNRATNKWEKVRGNPDNGIIDSIPLTDKLRIDESTSFSFNTLTREVSIITKGDVQIVITGPSGEEVGTFLSVLNEPVLLDTSSLAAGKYKVVLTKNDECVELYFVVGQKEVSHE